MTKTETLADILRTLSELAPERFNIYGSHQNRIALKGLDSFDIRCVDDWQHKARARALVVAACMEECEARGWDMMMVYDADSNHWSVNIQDWVQYRGDNDFEAVEIAAWDAPDLADALATALRDALEAEL